MRFLLIVLLAAGGACGGGARGLAEETEVAPAEGAPELGIRTAPAAEGSTAEGDEEAVAPHPDVPEPFRQLVIQQAAQYEPTLTAELATRLDLLRTLHGDLPVESRRAIRRAGERAVKEAAMRASERIHVPEGQFLKPGESVVAFAVEGLAAAVNESLGIAAAPAAPRPFDPRAHVGETLARALGERVGTEAAREFRDEIAKRESRRRDAIVRQIVAKLDEELSLADDQWGALERALREKWTDTMEMVPLYEMFQNGRRAYPGLPRRVVWGLLTEGQRERFGPDRETETERANRDNWKRMALFHGGRLNAAEIDPWWSE